MNLTSTTSQPQSGIDQLVGGSRNSRRFGASDARGFAQIMRAFTHEPESLVLRESSYSGRDSGGKADGLRDEPTARSREPQAEAPDSPGASEEPGAAPPGAGKSETPLTDQQASVPDAIAVGEQPKAVAAEPPVPTPEPTQTQPRDTATGPGQGASAPTEEHEAALRLLSRHSEQAKLSIKGLVRSLTHSTGADVTSAAVDTRLGRGGDAQHTGDDDGAVSVDRVRPEPARPDQAEQTPQKPVQHLSVSPGSPRPPVSAGVHRGAAQTAQPGSVESASDPSRPDVQRAVSERAVAQPTRPAPTLDATRQSQLETAGQVARVVRGGRAQSVRAVSGVDPASLGDQLKDTTTDRGSLVEKMSRPTSAEGPDRASLLAQVQRGLASLLRSGGGDMTLKLTPASLGEVRIRIKSEGNRLSVRFEASTDEASDLLNASAKDLSAHLRNRGVHVDHLSVDRRDAMHAKQDAQAPNPDQASTHGDQHAKSHQQPGAQDHSGSGRQPNGWIDEPVPFDDTDADQRGAIWTELGLDAIA